MIVNGFAAPCEAKRYFEGTSLMCGAGRHVDRPEAPSDNWA
jgi:hypothetical protein